MENSELKAIVRNRKLKPADLFEEEQLLEDPSIQKRLETEVEYKIYCQNKDLNDELAKEAEEDRKKKSKRIHLSPALLIWDRSQDQMTKAILLSRIRTSQIKSQI